MKVVLSNLKLNLREARFVNALVGREFSPAADFVRESDGQSVQIPCLNMDAVLRGAETDCIEVLHMDVQGAELPFLQSMAKAVEERNKIHCRLHPSRDDLQLATTHHDCAREIRTMGGHIFCEHSVSESFSGDGLIVASFFPCDRSLAFPSISRNQAATSLFR